MNNVLPQSNEELAFGDIQAARQYFMDADKWLDEASVRAARRTVVWKLDAEMPRRHLVASSPVQFYGRGHTDFHEMSPIDLELVGIAPKQESLRLAQLRKQRELNAAAVLADFTSVKLLEEVTRAEIMSIDALSGLMQSDVDWISLAKLFRAELVQEVGSGVATTAQGKAALRKWRTLLTNPR